MSTHKKEYARIAIAQINTTVGDLTGNRDKILEYIKKAKDLEADVIVFPELTVCGYPPEDLLLKKHFIDDNKKIVNQISRKIPGIVAILGFVDSDKKGNIYNSAAVIYNKKIQGVYHKITLPNYGVFDEKRYFSPGLKPKLFKLGNLCFGVSICEDIWDEKGPCKAESESGANLLINMSASPYHLGKRTLREKVLSKFALSTKNFICYANLVGGQDELVFDGASFVFAPDGSLLSIGKQFDEDLIIADIDLAKIKRKKTKRCSAVETVIISDKKHFRFEEQKPIKAKKMNFIEKVYNALVLGTRDYVEKSGFKKVVIGLSGGIDSSVTATIACEALGSENVVGVSMPSRYSSEATKGDAEKLAENLKIKFMTIPIEPVFSEYLDTLADVFEGTEPGVAEENIQARIRGNIIMALSNKFGWLVLTTGNKSEASVGYCTLYGDMAGGFAVIKDVSKTKLYELSDYINEFYEKEVIPISIIKRAPSAELREGQKDQDSLPPYKKLDEIIKKYVEEDKGFEEIAKTTKVAKSVIRDVIKMVDSNEYKRRQAPPGIRITPKAFGKDRRFPIVNKYKEV
ncbi:MAG: NAD+ synthase [Candidatus Omnitrophota bacterium]